MANVNIVDAGKATNLMAEKKKKFIKAATANAHGQFKAKAEAAGKSTEEFAEEHKGSPGLLGKQARLALTLMGLHKGKKDNKKKPRSVKEVQTAMYGKGK